MQDSKVHFEAAVLHCRRFNKADDGKEDGWLPFSVVTITDETKSNLKGSDGHWYSKPDFYQRRNGATGPSSRTVKLTFDPMAMGKARLYLAETKRKIEEKEMKLRLRQEWLAKPGPAMARRIVSLIQTSGDTDELIDCMARLHEPFLKQVCRVLNIEM